MVASKILLIILCIILLGATVAATATLPITPIGLKSQIIKNPGFESNDKNWTAQNQANFHIPGCGVNNSYCAYLGSKNPGQVSWVKQAINSYSVKSFNISNGFSFWAKTVFGQGSKAQLQVILESSEGYRIHYIFIMSGATIPQNGPKDYYIRITNFIDGNYNKYKTNLYSDWVNAKFPATSKITSIILYLDNSQNWPAKEMFDSINLLKWNSIN